MHEIDTDDIGDPEGGYQFLILHFYSHFFHVKLKSFLFRKMIFEYSRVLNWNIDNVDVTYYRSYIEKSLQQTKLQTYKIQI